MNHQTLLKYRVMDAINDDEEFIEEVLIDVNYAAPDSLNTATSPHTLVVCATTFRLWEIHACLLALCDSGLAHAHQVPGFPEREAAFGVAYGLTDAGLRFWKKHIAPVQDDLYELDRGRERLD
jgi:hypothetical protein